MFDLDSLWGFPLGVFLGIFVRIFVGEYDGFEVGDGVGFEGALVGEPGIIGDSVGFLVGVV